MANNKFFPKAITQNYNGMDTKTSGLGAPC